MAAQSSSSKSKTGINSSILCEGNIWLTDHIRGFDPTWHTSSNQSDRLQFFKGGRDIFKLINRFNQSDLSREGWELNLWDSWGFRERSRDRENTRVTKSETFLSFFFYFIHFSLKILNENGLKKVSHEICPQFKQVVIFSRLPGKNSHSVNARNLFLHIGFKFVLLLLKYEIVNPSSTMMRLLSWLFTDISLTLAVALF